jgi:hypothetical protein
MYSFSGIPAGYFTISSTGNSGNGTSNNTFNYVDLKGNTYTRDVDAAYDVITYDQQSGSLATTSLPTFSQASIPPPMPAARLPGGKGPMVVSKP